MSERAMIVMTTVDAEEDPQRIATALVEEGLAACVTVIPKVNSVYRWQGEIVHGEERLLLVKTTAPLFAAVRDRIKALHAYDVPEVLAVPVTDGLAAYLDWIEASVGTPRK